MQQIEAWAEAKRSKLAYRALARAQGITVSKANDLTVAGRREAARRHFRSAIAQERGRLTCFAVAVCGALADGSASSASGEETPLCATDVLDLASLRLIGRQRTDMPVHLKEAIADIGGGKNLRPRVVAAVAKVLDTPLPSRFQYPGGGRAGQNARRVKIPPSLRIAMLRHTCFKRVVEWAEAWSPAGQLPRGAPEAPAQGAPLRTPETIKEFADMLRDPVGVVRCPFGADFEEHAATASAGPLYRPHRDSLPWWLALVELHGDGYRFGASLDRELPYVFGLVADAVASKRAAREALPGGAPEHTLVVPDDLADALVANAVFRHKVGAYVLVQYALRPEEGLLSEVTQEQLRHGDVMAESSLLQPAAAAGIAAAFFDFALKYRLETALATMSSEHIQVLALFHSQLRRRPVKRVEVSERFDFIQAKPAYVEADAVASPEVPHFALVACDLPGDESGGAAEHSPPRTAVLQAPVICQLCGAGFLSPAGLW